MGHRVRSVEVRPYWSAPAAADLWMVEARMRVDGGSPGGKAGQAAAADLSHRLGGISAYAEIDDGAVLLRIMGHSDFLAAWKTAGNIIDIYSID